VHGVPDYPAKPSEKDLPMSVPDRLDCFDLSTSDFAITKIPTPRPPFGPLSKRNFEVGFSITIRIEVKRDLIIVERTTGPVRLACSPADSSWTVSRHPYTFDVLIPGGSQSHFCRFQPFVYRDGTGPRTPAEHRDGPSHRGSFVEAPVTAPISPHCGCGNHWGPC